MNSKPLSTLARLEPVLPWLVLALLVVYTYAFFFQAPYLGFRYSAAGEIEEIYVPDTPLQVGDRLEQLGSVTWEAFATDARQGWLDGQAAGSTLPLRFSRGGQTQTIDWRLPGRTLAELAERLNSQWWLGYIFWVAGTATYYLVRPKDKLWWLLLAFNYLTALWLTAGVAGSWRVWQGRVVLQSAMWFVLPVYLHLHWAFPSPLRPMPAWFRRLAYGLAAGLAIAEWFQLLPPGLFMGAFLVALAGSALLLLYRLLRRPGDRTAVGLLAVAVLLVMLPPIAVTLALTLGAPVPGYLQGGAILAFPALPGAYFFTVYRQQLGARFAPRIDRLATLYVALIVFAVLFIIGGSAVATVLGLTDSVFFAGALTTILAAFMALIGFAPFLALPALPGAYLTMARGRSPALEFRANRLIVPFLFFVLLATGAMVVVLLLTANLDFAGAGIVISLAVALLIGGVTALAYRPFRRLIHRHLLGIHLPQAELPEVYASRITTCLDRESLISCLAEEVLPSLAVRQSAILLTGGTEARPFLLHGLEAGDVPRQLPLPATAGETDDRALLATWRQAHPWLRFVLPLHFGGDLIGYWLWGRRDPDDLYAHAEARLLQVLADQTAVSLTNIVQRENLQALYRENIDRDEEERSHLARTLHDGVLNELAALAMHGAEGPTSDAFRQAYAAVNENLRRTISGLRAVSLQYGLHHALRSLTDDLEERGGEGPDILFELPPADVRYPAEVERHLYRIVQQAAENALQHAGGRVIRFEGGLRPARAEITVSDDGVGFDHGDAGMSTLLAEKHFGLAGMHERANLIGADLHIDTAPGRGTRVTVVANNIVGG